PDTGSPEVRTVTLVTVPAVAVTVMGSEGLARWVAVAGGIWRSLASAGAGAVAAVRRGDLQVPGQRRGVRRRRRGGLGSTLRGGDRRLGVATAAARGGQQRDDRRPRQARVPSRVP